MSSTPKIVVVGDGAVGKTCLLVVYIKGTFPKEYVPTVFDNYTAKVTIEGVTHNVQIWDTAGQEELENIRTLSYANTNIFLLAYSAVNPASFANIEATWLPELRKFVANPKVMLVATKTDLRDDPEVLQQLSSQNLKPITREQGLEKMKAIGAVAYQECSALNNQGVKEVFDVAITNAITPSKEGCCIII